MRKNTDWKQIGTFKTLKRTNFLTADSPKSAKMWWGGLELRHWHEVSKSQNLDVVLKNFWLCKLKVD